MAAAGKTNELIPLCQGILDALQKPVTSVWMGRQVTLIEGLDAKYTQQEKGSCAEENAFKVMKEVCTLFSLSMRACTDLEDTTTIVTFEPGTRQLFQALMKGFDFRYIRNIGSGSYARVWELVVGDQCFAAKVVRRTDNCRRRLSDVAINDTIKSFRREFKAGILAESSPHITRPLHWLNTSSTPILIFPLGIGVVHQYLHKLSGNDVIAIVVSVFRGLYALKAHRGGAMAHQDITTLNILLTREGYWTLNDFGFCERVGTRIRPLASIYRSPEHQSKEMQVNHSTDVWAVGCIMLMMLTGESFAKNIDRRDFIREGGTERVVHALLQRNERRARRLDPTGMISKLMIECLAFDPAKRPTIEEALEHLGLSSETLDRASTISNEGSVVDEKSERKEFALTPKSERSIHLSNPRKEECAAGGGAAGAGK